MKRVKRSMLVCILAIVLTTLLTATVAEAAGLTRGKWGIVPSPNAGSVLNFLQSVAALSANDLWTVGYYENSNNFNQALIEHWNGTSWQVVPSPNVGPLNNELQGVAAVSARNIWAAGFYYKSRGPYQTLIEHWNGTNWRVVPSPNAGSVLNFLHGVTAISARNIWAVGYYEGDNNAYQTLIEHWNGISWQVVPSPNAGSKDNELQSVAAVSARNIWAVGYYESDKSGFIQTLIEHWAGTSWQVVPSPNVGSSINFLQGVAALSANDIWGVGNYFSNRKGAYQTLIEHWNGTSWQVASSPNVPGSRVNELQGVAAISARNIWAVGYYESGNIATQTLIEHWIGTS